MPQAVRQRSMKNTYLLTYSQRIFQCQNGSFDEIHVCLHLLRRTIPEYLAGNGIRLQEDRKTAILQTKRTAEFVELFNGYYVKRPF